MANGIPLLIAAERSLFDVTRSEMWGKGEAPSAGVRSRLFRMARWVLDLPPSPSRNVGTRENFRRLAGLLHEQPPRGELPARVLIVGGGDAGVGTDELLTDPHLDLLQTDVFVGRRTQVVCDAHDLPFVDASFDAVVCQAVLEHVLDPARVAAEIWRVLAPGGLLYSEIPFMQQVHAGAFDFTRFTHTGHRLLLRSFDEIVSGANGGPGMALVWSIAYFFRAPLPRRLWPLADRTASVLFFWLKYLDDRLVHRPGGLDAASGTFFLGRRREEPLPAREIVRGYRGGGPALDW